MRNDPVFICGLDLGQASDPSALCVLRRTVRVDSDHTPPRWREAHYECPHLQRWPLGTSYVRVVADVAELLARPPLVRCDLVLDASGCGRPIFDLFREKVKEKKLAARLHGVIITAGLAESFTDGFHHVAKVVLISTVQVALQQRRLQFAASLPDVPVLVKEFENYRVRITPAANEVFNAREGTNDDLLLAVSVGLWRGERMPLATADAPAAVPWHDNVGGYAHGSPGTWPGGMGRDARGQPFRPWWAGGGADHERGA